jgi:hypothetical protein
MAFVHDSVGFIWRNISSGSDISLRLELGFFIDVGNGDALAFQLGSIRDTLAFAVSHRCQKLSR